MDSLDPRINRIAIPEKWDGDFKKSSLDQLETFEVFVQPKENKAFQHEGIVHASDLELAFLFAKEQFSRRYTCSGMWVCKTSDVYVSPYTEDGKTVYEIKLPVEQNGAAEKPYEIFHLYKRGKQHKHVGTVKAKSHINAIRNAGINIEEAKPVLNIWVIDSSKIYANKTEDVDIWNTLPDKQFRDAIAYRGAEKIKEYKSRVKNNE
ncbi:MAG TPA: phenylacetic acid degradation b [Cyclobacteriaceae bacterium]|jgi:ring-1,2-phenylacetyl-CoA epoxidase subunit PaaB